ncbi:hypothetical protein [Methylomonas sp. MK1]|uniref:hypothetical protein n=1 Tax=Methylomonas sp. MK1 TaxID=1131552 RepID=UPI0003659EAD|nr:hypothetical protein [Methylomonas sp. MK1]
MLSLNEIDDDYCQGIEFDITDIDSLAKTIALVLIQEYDMARNLVTGNTFSEDTAQFDQDEIEDIIQRRLHPTVIYHRDGFLFQLMMWLAAHLDLQDDDLVALPHSQGSAKGQDSIVVHRSTDAVVALTICEDKATENPRDMVRDEVWPEIKEYEQGGRRDELRSNIIATLGTGGISSTEAQNLIRGISWNGKRRYRVRVTVEPNKRTSKLFKGFEEIVKGDNEMRRGETTTLPSMRDWMTTFAEKTEIELRKFAQGA